MNYERFNNLDESPENYSECKASPNRLYCIYGSIYITFLKLQSCRNGKQISGCQMLGWGK